MNNKDCPVKDFFNAKGQQPAFWFQQFFPFNFTELSGKEYQQYSSQLQEFSFCFKSLFLILTDDNLRAKLDKTRAKENLIFSILQGKPLVFPKSFIENWKNIEFNKVVPFLSSSETKIYQEYLNENIDKAYLFNSDNELGKNVWSTWFRKVATYEQVYNLVYFNWKLFEEAHELYGSKEENKSLVWISEIFSLTPNDKKVLNFLALEKKANVISEISRWTKLLQYYFLSFNIEEQIDFLAKVFDLNTNDIIQFLKNKKLIEVGLLKDVLKGKNFFSDVALENKLYKDTFFEDKFDTILSCTFESREHLLDVLIHIDKDYECQLNIHDYEYLNPELDSIIKSLAPFNKPVDILIWGKPGTGKTELAKVIAKELHYSICNISKFTQETESNYSARINKLCSSKNFSNILGDFITLVDEAEDILQSKLKHVLTEQLENKKVNTIWILNDITNIEAAYLRRFDYIQEITGMPFQYRKKLATKLLGQENNDLAYKIAQAMHTPAEIVSAVEWCANTKNYTWENVLVKMAGYQKVLSQSQKNNSHDFVIDIIPPELNSEKGLKNFAGYQYLHAQAEKIKDLFNKPDKYQKMGAKIPKGILLAGEPGVGKTLFAKCLANEISIPIIKADSAALAAHDGAIADLFEQARAHAPCMVFLDEIDVIASDVMDKNGVNTEKQKLLNQLLIQMDGFDPLEGVMVVGATHRHYLLDKAVTRSGRFGEILHFRSPSQEDRTHIWKYYTNSVPTDAASINYETLAKLSATLSAADIAQCVNNAAIYAALSQQEHITQINFENACNEVFWGNDATGLPITKREQWKTAIHESGHALIALKNKQQIKRATIRPHLNFLGAVELERPEGSYTNTLQQIKQNAEIFFGGMIAEEIIFGHHATSVSDDLNKASSFVLQALLSYGMSQTLGPVVFIPAGPEFSEQRRIELEVEQKSILDISKKEVESWLNTNKVLLLDLAKLMLDKRSLTQSELYSWFNDTLSQDQMELLDADNDCTFEQLIAMASQKIVC